MLVFTLALFSFFSPLTPVDSEVGWTKHRACSEVNASVDGAWAEGLCTEFASAPFLTKKQKA